MPASSLLALLDDIATILDDVAVLTKVATKKTAGVLGDDLALNAQQVSGVVANRELPVVWAVAKGSAINKAILVPAALAISAFVPGAVTPLLMIGGAYLCFEGVEKLAHRWLHDRADDEANRAKLRRVIVDPSVDVVAVEKEKIKGAIRTDFILSAEIVTIALGTVAGQPFVTRVAVLTTIAVMMTVGVYGLVAGIVKLDDLGLHLTREGVGNWRRRLGVAILKTAPYLMKALSVGGTIAMFLVGGGILSHGLGFLHVLSGQLTAGAAGVPGIGGLLAFIVPLLVDLTVGLLMGTLLVVIVTGVQRVVRGRKSSRA